jgi:transcriptional regulator GlxA family with amidase domain
MCEAILKNPSTWSDINYWAIKTGMSRRTLTRHFRLETGISIATWIKQARLIEAMSRLAEGASMTIVAFEVG